MKHANTNKNDAKQQIIRIIKIQKTPRHRPRRTRRRRTRLRLKIATEPTKTKRQQTIRKCLSELRFLFRFLYDDNARTFVFFTFANL